MTEHLTQQARLFESFNARFLSNAEVAASFIPPPQFATLIELGHSVLMGPRGSGKTTLFKMLQLRSLALWSGDGAEEAQREIAFHAIFVGTDTLWGAQLESKLKSISSEDVKNEIRRTAFRLHLNIALLDALAEGQDPLISGHELLSRFAFTLSKKTELELCGYLASLWRCAPDLLTLRSLRAALRIQVVDLLALIDAVRIRDKSELPDFCFVDWIASLSGAIDIVNDVLGQPSRKWAVLCDEIEIAPQYIREELLRGLRSTHQCIHFKFSLYPYSGELASMLEPDQPTENNDVKSIPLWYPYREESYKFCAALLRGMITKGGGDPDLEPESIFGEGWFDGGRGQRRASEKSYSAPQGAMYRKIKELQQIDKSFRDYLREKDISPEHIHSLEEDKQAVVRRPSPFIVVRALFLRESGSERSVRAARAYIGAYSLFSITEGNPRAFINLMKPLVALHLQKKGTVSAIAQTNAINLTIARFRASLSVLPTAGEGDVKSVTHLVTLIGAYFRGRVLGRAFDAEPPTTFVVDEKTPMFVRDLVGRGLNAGAFVIMPPDSGQLIPRTIVGARMRLAYTLAPFFRLPLLASREINLSSMYSHARTKHQRSGEPQTALLPFDQED